MRVWQFLERRAVEGAVLVMVMTMTIMRARRTSRVLRKGPRLGCDQTMRRGM
jgi:hypothetical protein